MSARVMFYLLAWFKCQLLTLVGVLPFSSLGSLSASLCRLTLSLPISFPNLYEPANSFPREYWSASDVLAPELSAPPSAFCFATCGRPRLVAPSRPGSSWLRSRSAGCAQSATQHPSPRQHDAPACCLHSVLMCRPSLPFFNSFMIPLLQTFLHPPPLNTDRVSKREVSFQLHCLIYNAVLSSPTIRLPPCRKAFLCTRTMLRAVQP